MSALELVGVSKRFRHGHRELIALRDVSLVVEPGEVVSISGGRGSGRTTLIRIAGGLERPDAGEVRFAGTDLQRASAAQRRRVVVAGTRFLPAHGARVFQQVMMPLLALRVSPEDAGIRAQRALEQLGVGDLALASPEELLPGEAVRVGLARAIVREPQVLLLDDPASRIELLERDPLLQAIAGLARDTGAAVVTTAGESASVTGADRCLRLSAGELLGRPPAPSAAVVELRRPRARPA
jgi:ABC-type lipoprotein export system ATPase subunit